MRCWSISAPSMPSGARRSRWRSARKGGAQRGRRPWVLDPVFIDRSPARAHFAQGLSSAARRRCGSTSANLPRLPAAMPRATRRRALPKPNNTVVALSGETDLVTDGERSATIANGHALMARSPPWAAPARRWSLRALAVEARCAGAPRRARWSRSASPAKWRRRKRSGPGSFAGRHHRRAPQSRRRRRSAHAPGCQHERRSSPLCDCRSGALGRPRSRRSCRLCAQAARRWCNCATSISEPAPWSKQRARSNRRWSRPACRC